MIVKVEAYGDGAQAFVDKVRAVISAGYSVTTLSEQRAGNVVTLAADIEPKPSVGGKLASGGVMEPKWGVVGEPSPEAVMPLLRGPDGNHGVNADPGEAGREMARRAYGDHANVAQMARPSENRG